MVEFKDYYKTLGVERSASPKEIKAAFRRLARQHHPDVNPGDRKAEARFKEINEANEVLSDPDKRQRYDQLGADWDSLRPAGVRFETRGFGGEEAAGFSDFFRTFFGGGEPDLEGVFRSVPPAGGGRDVERSIELTLEEIARGTTRTLDVGRGRRVEARIPPGVREGSRVRIAGEGSGRAGGPRGDLYLRVSVAPHPVFERDGDDLRIRLRVPVTTAVLGGEAEVPTLDGPVGIKVPAGTPVGRSFRLKGHGLPRLEAGGGRGDLLAELLVEVPRELSKRERELFEELRRLGR